MKILETKRLILRTITVDDAAFYLALINSPGWLANIGDRGVRMVEQARETLLAGVIEVQNRLGFSFYITELKNNDDTSDGSSNGTIKTIGLCGLIKREGLDDVDIGYVY